MPLRTKILGTTALLGSASYLSYSSRHPTLLDAPAALPTPSAPTTPASAKSAYDRREESMYLVPEPATGLQTQISGLRRRASDLLVQADLHARLAVDRVIGAEQSVESTLRSLRDPREPLLPGLLYVSVAGLSGSIVARRRALPLRVLTPLALFLAAGAVVLPRTSRNVGDLAYEVEGRVPALRRLHDDTRAALAGGLWRAGTLVESAERQLDSAVHTSKVAFEKGSGIQLPK